MLTNLLFANIHFLVTSFAALVFFSAGWIHLHTLRRNSSRIVYQTRVLGYYLIALTFIMQTASINIPIHIILEPTFQIMGCSLLLLSLGLEPAIKTSHTGAFILPVILPFTILITFNIAASILFFAVAVFYYVRSYNNPETKLPFLAFLLLAISQSLNSLEIYKSSTVVFWTRFLADNGPVWIIQHALLLTGSIVMATWVWKYISLKVQNQLFIIFITRSFVVFAITTFLLTALMLNNIKGTFYKQLNADANTIRFALEEHQLEALANARAVAKTLETQENLITVNNPVLSKTMVDYMKAQQLDFVAIFDSEGGKIFSGGNSINVPNMESKYIVTQGVVAPIIQTSAEADIAGSKTGKVIGKVYAGFTFDNAFVDTIHERTGLDVSLFGGDLLAATTITAPNETSRFLGTKVSDPKIITNVLTQGKDYEGETTVLNSIVLASYLPIKSDDGKVIGMISVVKPEKELLDIADNSFKLTFFGSVIVIILSMAPAYFLAKSTEKSVRAADIQT